MLRVGPVDPWFTKAKHLQVAWTGLLPRREIPKYACRAQVGVVCDNGKWDSGPRILPEMLAMDIPVIVRSCVRASRKYITEQTGMLVGEDRQEFVSALVRLLSSDLHPVKYYREHLSLPRAAERLSKAIASALRRRRGGL